MLLNILDEKSSGSMCEKNYSAFLTSLKRDKSARVFNDLSTGAHMVGIQNPLPPSTLSILLY